MAANYWDSTQAKYWTFTRKELAAIRGELEKNNLALHQKYPLPDPRIVAIYIQTNLLKFARRMSLRQQAVATAQVYIKRFYLRVEMRRMNPYLIMTTAVYLACKVEECPQHIRVMLNEAARQWPELGVTESSKIGECEFALISTLSSRLILHHPYKLLGELVARFGMTSEEQGVAHSIVNDSFVTDLCLIYPPHIISITAIFMALILKPSKTPSAGQSTGASSSAAQDQSPVQSPGGSEHPSPSATPRPSENPALSAAAAQKVIGEQAQTNPRVSKMVEWLAESRVDMDAITDAIQEMVSVYELWDSFAERPCKEAFGRFMSAQNK